VGVTYTYTCDVCGAEKPEAELIRVGVGIREPRRSEPLVKTSVLVDWKGKRITLRQGGDYGADVCADCLTGKPIAAVVHIEKITPGPLARGSAEQPGGVG
jgi:hypothetical protein